MLIFVGILFILSLVILHELGHFLAAKRAGIEVEEFGIGFPPKAGTITVKNGTAYTINWLPLGGFVKLKGEHDSDIEPGSYGVATLPQKMLVMIAGVAVNMLIAVLLLSIIAAVSMPKVLENQFSIASDTKIVQQDVIVSSVSKDSPAEVAGLKAGDVITHITPENCAGEACNPRAIVTGDDLRNTTKELAGQKVLVEYVRDSKKDRPESTVVELSSQQAVEDSKLANEVCAEAGEADCPSVKGYLGVSPSDYIKQRSTWSAPIVGVALTGQFFWETLKGIGGIIGDLFSGNAAVAGEQVTGVVGIGYVLSQLSAQGFMSVLFLTAVISVSLAVMNVLPIPALDGGRLFVTLLFRVLKLPLNKRTEERIHGTGFALLMVLFVLITVLDVKKFIL